ncbi:CAMK family protein kinase [Histomonas meleagridis]|uniref:CAMK family protein kinase n=1 Tax=Histomonas meleagridis TaxID=135588 RepID=UPI00355A19D5|nr:CAMK family protein kinase [Histomonas meleagridis]KAH0797987.1 CAMK family protein kinase [Histomonas meleagridis]
MEETLIQLSGAPVESNLIYFKQFMLALKYLHDHDFPHKNITISSMRIDSNGILILYGASIFPALTAESNITEYMAPECFTGEPYDEKKADIWSAGICLYAMLYNHLPWMIDENEEDYDGALVQQIQSGEVIYEDFLGSPYIELISSMLRLNPDDRPTATEVLENPILSALEIERYHNDETDTDGSIIALFDAIIANAQDIISDE